MPFQVFDDNYPTYLQVRRLITQAIANNDYIEGLKIPTANQMAEEYSTNHHTVRRAEEGLVSMGLLRVMRGKGTYVADGALEKARTIGRTLITGYELEKIVRTARASRIKQAELIDLVKAEFKKQFAEGE